MDMSVIETATVFLLVLLAFGICWEVWWKNWREWTWTANRAAWAHRTGRDRLARWLLGVGALLLALSGAAWADECPKGGDHELGSWGRWVWTDSRWDGGLCVRVYKRVASCTKCKTSRTETETRSAPTTSECRPGGGSSCSTGSVSAPALSDGDSASPMTCTPYDYTQRECCGGVWTFGRFLCTDGHRSCRYVRTCSPESTSRVCGDCS